MRTTLGLVLTLAVLGAATAAHAEAGSVSRSAASRAPVSRARFALGADVYFLDPDPMASGAMSVTYGDGEGVDFELKVSTVLLASFVEAGPRIYLASSTIKPFLYAGVGTALILFLPSDLYASAGVGLLVADHIELSASAFYTRGGEFEDESFGHGTRVSFGVRF